MTELKITFLGTSAAVPTMNRGLSAVSIQRGADYLLFDCGEGTQRQMVRYTGLKAPKAIFLTHHHTDHWLGLPGLICSLEMNEFEGRLPIYMPLTMVSRIRAVLQASRAMAPFVDLHTMNPGLAYADLNFRVSAFATKHCTGSQGYIFEEPFRPGRFDPRMAMLKGIEPGPDFKRLQNGETVRGIEPDDVMGPPRPGRKIVYTSDTAYDTSVAQAAYHADVLIHEATFDKSTTPKRLNHSTGAEAGQIAKQAVGLKRLVLTHFSASCSPKTILDEAKNSFLNTTTASDGMSLNVPLED